ncbi:hypothetical protein [Sulfitobacter sp. R18_1]|uniref:hypothetical protein n=1 Tax=Sulfitobacter sp. R18_1 TaxID=2821104 RepID=UPI001ADCAFCF|nr:hypothetical protein [Sulfitobacter sp. R18_1]MBO9429630.1 hypothetical protein [Sulfitobacter sp. R18_1]
MRDEDGPKYFDFEERQRQKARARQRDEERLERGKISPAELQRENMPFRKLRRDRVAIYRSKKTGEFVWMSFERKRGPEGSNED